MSCWPTLVFVGPSGQLLYSVAGEGHRQKVLDFLKVATEHYSNELNKCDLPVALEKDKLPISSLSFPGKICLWTAKKSIVIADSGNHRVVVTDSQGIVKVCGLEFLFFQEHACYEKCGCLTMKPSYCTAQQYSEGKRKIGGGMGGNITEKFKTQSCCLLFLSHITVAMLLFESNFVKDGNCQETSHTIQLSIF